MTEWCSPREIARVRRVSVSKIHAWIRSGELDAVNLATSRMGRPRWRISQESLAAFDRCRSSRAALTPRVQRRRRFSDSSEKAWF
jgi:predicted site-specific integrase-resolvase